MPEILAVVITAIITGSLCWGLTLLSIPGANGVDVDAHGEILREWHGSIEWIRDRGGWIGRHWGVFCTISTVSGIIVGMAVTLGPATAPTFVSSLFISSAATVLGVLLVFSGAIDWTYHKIPLYPMIAIMLISYASAITVTAVTPAWRWLLPATIIVPIMLWLLGLVPGSGMGDGRLFALTSSCVIPMAAQTSLWAVLIMCAMDIAYAIIGMIIPGAGIRTEHSGTGLALKIRGFLGTHVPMGPFCMIAIVLWIILVAYGVVISPTVVVHA